MLAATLLGRMCVSGDVTDLSLQQWHTVDEGIAFYKRVAPIISVAKSLGSCYDDGRKAQPC